MRADESRRYGIRFSKIRYLQRHARALYMQTGLLENSYLFKPINISLTRSSHLGRALIGLAAVMTTDELIQFLKGR